MCKRSVLWNKRRLPASVGFGIGILAMLGVLLILAVNVGQEPRPAWTQGPTENLKPVRESARNWHPQPWGKPVDLPSPLLSQLQVPALLRSDMVNEPSESYLRLRANQTHDWVDACTTSGATVEITLTDALGNVKGTASGVALREGGCIWGGDFDWGGPAPDIVAGDRVDGSSSDGSTAAVTVIAITGQVDIEANTLSGQVHDVSYPATMRGEIWEEGATSPEAQTDDQGYFTLDFNPFNIQLDMEVAAWYVYPDGDWAGAVFLARRPPGPIQAAINAAEDGDTVVIPPGVYTETINFNGKHITVRSEDPDDPNIVQATVIDGGQDGSVVTFESGETSDAALEGFTITDGLSSFGGGISILNASPTITNNIIAKNGGATGGGIYVEGNEASPVIRSNWITDNIATEWGGGIAIRDGSSPVVQNNVVGDNLAMEGAGIEITNKASPVIAGNTLTGNWAGADMHFPLHAEQHLNGIDIRERLDAFPSFGAGILIINHSSPVIKNNTISDSFGSGVAVIYDSSPRIEDNTISGNLGENLGGGILVGLGSSPQIFGNQITENSAKWGGGIQIFRDSSPLIQGNTIMANFAEIGGGGLYVWDHASPVVTDNTLGDNRAIEGGAIWVDRTSSILDTEGNPLDLGQLYTRIEEIDESFIWTGYWEPGSGACYSGGRRMGSGQAGAKVDIRFTGTGVSLVYLTSDDHGIAEIAIDGVSYPDIDMYASDGRCQVEELIAADLALSEHVLTITVSGDKNPSSSDTFIVVDAVDVTSSDPSSVGGNQILGSVYVQPPPPWNGEPGSGRTLLVPDEYPGIQAAIDSAEHGDTVVVAPGTYQGNIDFRGKEIVVRSQNPDDGEAVEATVIEPTEPYPVVTFESGETSKAILNGFTIRNGLESGAIWIQGSSPIIANNIITDNVGHGISCGRACSARIQNNVIRSNIAEHGGGGINCYLSTPTIEDNVIADNKAGTGAGIGVWISSPYILHNTIIQNEITDRGGNGGGIFLDHFSMATVKDNLIQGNIGGGVHIDSSAPTIDSNVIVENRAAEGGGIFLFLDSSPDIRNNIIADNTGGGGIGVSFLNSPDITHNTIANNESSGQCSGIAAYGRSTISVTNTILWNEGDNICVEESGSEVVATHSDVKGGWPGEGNISRDPLLMDPSNGDYHLRLGSPAIDAGADIGVATDFEDDPRPWGFGVDMGADEFVGHVVDPGCCDFLEPPGVDMADAQFIAEHWRWPAWPPYDCDGDGIITVADIMCVIEQLGANCP